MKELIHKRFKEAYRYCEKVGLIGSQKMAAEDMNITPQHLSNILHDLTMATTEVIHRFCTAYGVRLDYLFYGKLPILERDVIKKQVSDEIKRGLPLIPIDAMAGFAVGIDDPVMAAELYYVPEFNKKADFLIRVSGSSMYPKYNSGDIVACKKLPIDTFFQWNKIYVLDTIQGPLIKRVKKGPDNDHLELISDNPQYDPFLIKKSEIHSIALVIGTIRLE